MERERERMEGSGLDSGEDGEVRGMETRREGRYWTRGREMAVGDRDGDGG
jgi:hypothetical protein